jgi:hypothetical protein
VRHANEVRRESVPTHVSDLPGLFRKPTGEVLRDRDPVPPATSVVLRVRANEIDGLLMRGSRRGPVPGHHRDEVLVGDVVGGLRVYLLYPLVVHPAVHEEEPASFGGPGGSSDQERADPVAAQLGLKVTDERVLESGMHNRVAPPRFVALYEQPVADARGGAEQRFTLSA